LENIGWYFRLWVISGNVVGALFVFLLCPETGGKTLEQVDYLFDGKGFAGLRKADDTDSSLGVWEAKDGTELRESVE
jgi:hypothetical protein